jgi:hypothetical protein
MSVMYRVVLRTPADGSGIGPGSESKSDEKVPPSAAVSSQHFPIVPTPRPLFPGKPYQSSRPEGASDEDGSSGSPIITPSAAPSAASRELLAAALAVSSIGESLGPKPPKPAAIKPPAPAPIKFVLQPKTSLSSSASVSNSAAPSKTKEPPTSVSKHHKSAMEKR